MNEFKHKTMTMFLVASVSAGTHRGPQRFEEPFNFWKCLLALVIVIVRTRKEHWARLVSRCPHYFPMNHMAGNASRSTTTKYTKYTKMSPRCPAWCVTEA